jgi:hypothetical protein
MVAKVVIDAAILIIWIGILIETIRFKKIFNKL